jgi:hypothetical protein
MGLLGKANAKSVADSPNVNSAPVKGAVSIDIQDIIRTFHQNNPLFHCLLLRPENDGAASGGIINDGVNGDKNDFLEIAAMSAPHGVECVFLPDGNCLVLLPGNLDIDLFSHRFSKSTGSTLLSQFSADSPSLAFEQLKISNE